MRTSVAEPPWVCPFLPLGLALSRDGRSVSQASSCFYYDAGCLRNSRLPGRRGRGACVALGPALSTPRPSPRAPQMPARGSGCTASAATVICTCRAGDT